MAVINVRWIAALSRPEQLCVLPGEINVEVVQPPTSSDLGNLVDWSYIDTEEFLFCDTAENDNDVTLDDFPFFGEPVTDMKNSFAGESYQRGDTVISSHNHKSFCDSSRRFDGHKSDVHCYDIKTMENTFNIASVNRGRTQQKCPVDEDRRFAGGKKFPDSTPTRTIARCIPVGTRKQSLVTHDNLLEKQTSLKSVCKIGSLVKSSPKKFPEVHKSNNVSKHLSNLPVHHDHQSVISKVKTSSGNGYVGNGHLPKSRIPVQTDSTVHQVKTDQKKSFLPRRVETNKKKNSVFSHLENLKLQPAPNTTHLSRLGGELGKENSTKELRNHVQQARLKSEFEQHLLRSSSLKNQKLDGNNGVGIQVKGRSRSHEESRCRPEKSLNGGCLADMVPTTGHRVCHCCRNSHSQDIESSPVHNRHSIGSRPNTPTKPWAKTLRDYDKSPSPVRSRKSTPENSTPPPSRAIHVRNSSTDSVESRDSHTKKREDKNLLPGTKSDSLLQMKQKFVVQKGSAPLVSSHHSDKYTSKLPSKKPVIKTKAEKTNLPKLCSRIEQPLPASSKPKVCDSMTESVGKNPLNCKTDEGKHVVKPQKKYGIAQPKVNRENSKLPVSKNYFQRYKRVESVTSKFSEINVVMETNCKNVDINRNHCTKLERVDNGIEKDNIERPPTLLKDPDADQLIALCKFDDLSEDIVIQQRSCEMEKTSISTHSVEPAVALPYLATAVCFITKKNLFNVECKPLNTDVLGGKYKFPEFEAQGE